MHGILGGFLGIVNFFGKLLLAAFIGWTLARKNNRTARWTRILMGSLFTGIVIGFFAAFYFLTPFLQYWDYELSPNDFYGAQVVAFAIAIIAIVIIATFLEHLRETIEEEPPDS